MDEIDDSDILPPSPEELADENDENVELSDDSITIRAPKTGIGLKTLCLGMLIAAGGGAVGGSFLAKTLAPPAVKTDLTAVENSLKNLSRETASLKTQLSQVQTTAQEAVQASANAVPVNIGPVESQLAEIELTLADLETALAAKPSGPAIDEDILARLEALQAEGSPALDLSDITQRLETVETAPNNEDLRELVQDLYERQAELRIALEDATAAMDASAISAAQQEPAVQASAITVSAAKLAANFPETELIAAIEGLAKPQGWAQRTLNKHISVQSEDDPRSLVAGIKTDLDEGDIQSALAKFDRLPEPVRMAGQAWRAAINR